ncbi:uncharacterized protein N7469_000003 [Penicillium citrinum]|uniref:Uncharacterized protein n=1 Tax=Penicillium citrinum TaxID=5077 RepID=A0A9W9TUA5_PENCI|nr:uncharacterized protein N7469_000003 [Penicillium citrinum]KAJ5241676.1 hypothetical protein N7469_000003 [Penicillium citrinum]
MQLLYLLFAVLHFGLGLASTHQHTKRGAETNATIYAYGANASSWPIAYGVSDEDPTVTDGILPIEWDLASITGECWIANATFVNGTKVGSMYIKPEQGNAVGILPQTRVAYLNGTVSGFALFATQLVYNNNTLLEAQFWAKSTNTTGVYSLMWTLDDSEPNGDFPVVVKASEDSSV